MESLAMMSLILVELWVLSFCFKKLEMIMLLPRVVQNPECSWKLEWVLWEPSAYQLTLPVPLLCKISGRSGVVQRYHIM